MSVERNRVEAAIYEKYIRPTKRPAQPCVGVEIELPIVNLKKEGVDFAVIHRLVDAFSQEFGFDLFRFDDEGNVNSASSSQNGDDLSFDCSYNTIEFSFGKECDLNEIHRRLLRYAGFVQDFLRSEHHTVTGMGINPYYQYNRNVPVPNGRYRMLFHHLYSYKKYEGQMRFHDIPYFGLISCASQCHLDVEEEEIPQTINSFNRLEPLKALIFANSPLGDDLLCARDYLWKHSLHGLNRHNVDGYAKELQSVEELVSYIRSMSLYCLEREGKYINFPPTPLDEYFGLDLMTGEYFNGQEYERISFRPELEDLEYLRSFKFVDLTYRGTVELRSVCSQPLSETLGAPAFHAGLKENLSELTDYLKQEKAVYQQGYDVEELRGFFVRRELPAFADRSVLAGVLTDIVDIARRGLLRRGNGEERFLEPVMQRAEKLLSPAREMAEGLESGKSMEYYIDRFGELA